MKNYDPNPLKDITFEEAEYIYGTAEVGSELWKNASNRMVAMQQSLINDLAQSKKEER